MPKRLTLRAKMRKPETETITIESPKTMVALRDGICLALRNVTEQTPERDQFLGFMYALCWVLLCPVPEDLGQELVIDVD